MNQLTEHDQAVNAKLTAMRDDGWQAIKEMSGRQLDEFMDELNATGRFYDSLNPFVILRGEAVQAVKSERHARTLKIMQENQARDRRRDAVHQAILALNTAREKLEILHDFDLYELIETPPQLQHLTADDMADKDDDELVSLLQAYSHQAKSAYESQAVNVERLAAFAFAKPREARSPERFFGVVADGWNACAEIASSNVQLISDELDSRRAKREAQEAARTPKALEERITELESKLAEMEGK